MLVVRTESFDFNGATKASQQVQVATEQAVRAATAEESEIQSTQFFQVLAPADQAAMMVVVASPGPHLDPGARDRSGLSTVVGWT